MNETVGGMPLSSPADTGAILALQNVYLKDCSYESPNGPRLDGNWNPQINLDLQTSSTSLGPEVREVVLTVTVSAKHGEATIFLVEVKQAGLSWCAICRSPISSVRSAPCARECCSRMRARRSRSW